MAKYCKKCGTQLDEDTHLCPKCDAKKIKRLKKKKKKSHKWLFLKVFLIVLAIVLVLGGIVFSLAYFNIVDIPVISNMINKEEIIEEDEEEEDITLEDLEDIDLAEEVLNSSEVLGTTEVAASSQITTEKDTVELFNERGFDASQVTSSYTIDGTYYSEEVIDETSTSYHPIYSLLYISDDSYYWYIYCIDGEFFAYPTTYILYHMDESETYISESEYIISYDSYTNYFNRIIPNDSTIITVDEINVDTLNELASKELSES